MGTRVTATAAGRTSHAGLTPHPAGYHPGRGRHHRGTDLEGTVHPPPSRYLVRELDRIPSESLPATYAVVGAGRLGHALTGALRDAGVAVEGPLGRSAAPQAAVVLLTVPDGEIRAAAES